MAPTHSPGALARPRCCSALALAFIAKAAALVAGFQIGAYSSFAVSPPTDISVASIAILLALISTFIPSIAEDILTRGLWWRATPWMTGAAFILITSVIYVLNHIFRLAEGPAEWIRLFCFGIAYAAAMARFRTLWAAVGLHWGWNLANTLLDQFTQPRSDALGIRNHPPRHGRHCSRDPQAKDATRPAHALVLRRTHANACCSG
ncbi:MAG: CPBP family intramembrane metalloprotease [Alphaproteobacteria bacterium]|nr:MAG: CPBP family intramembrane metalloprotease [Alphaproteobacteria bacterium]